MGICVVHVAKVGLYVTIFSLPPLVTSHSDPWFVLEACIFIEAGCLRAQKLIAGEGGP